MCKSRRQDGRLSSAIRDPLPVVFRLLGHIDSAAVWLCCCCCVCGTEKALMETRVVDVGSLLLFVRPCVQSLTVNDVLLISRIQSQVSTWRQHKSTTQTLTHFIFSLTHLFVSVCAPAGGCQSACDRQEAAASLSHSLTPSFPPLFQDEGPQHLISTSAVKVQRLVALLHIMKEGGPLILIGWLTEGSTLVFFLLSSFFPISFRIFPSFLRNCLFSLFCFGAFGRGFSCRENNLCCSFLHTMGKNTFIHIMLKACARTHTHVTQQTHSRTTVWKK